MKHSKLTIFAVAVAAALITYGFYESGKQHRAAERAAGTAVGAADASSPAMTVTNAADGQSPPVSATVKGNAPQILPMTQALERCLPQVKAQSMDDLVKALPAAWGEPTAKKELWSNEHYLVNGLERRIRRELTDNGTMEEKAYSLDDEGLPDPMDAPPEERNRWRQQGSLEYKAAARRLAFNGGWGLEYEEEQGHVTKALLFLGGRALQCESTGCICQ